MKETTKQNQEPASLDVIYNLAISRLDTQMREVSTLLTRVGTVWSIAGLIIGVTAGFLATHGASMPKAVIVLSALGLVTFLVLTSFSVLTHAKLGFRYPPKVRSVWEQALFWEPARTQQQILSFVIPAIEANRTLLSKRTKYATWCLYLLIGEVILAIAAIACLYSFD